MIASGPLDSASNFVFSIYGLLTAVAMLLLFGILWSDQIKRKLHDSRERKKWQHWNLPKR